MIGFCYDCLLLIALLFALPKMLWQRIVHGKYRDNFFAKWGFSLPQIDKKRGQKVIWIHAISMGETRACIPLFRLIQKHHPDALLVISSTTETGHEEAKKCLPDAAAYFFLPFDFSWILRSLMKRIQPTTLILCESDFWYHLLKMAKKQGATICLANGKISERSMSRFQKFPWFSKHLFSFFDHLCVQSTHHEERFLKLGIPQEKLFVTGNLKFDGTIHPMDNATQQTFLEQLHLTPADPILVIGSTHFPEEKNILTVLKRVMEKIPSLKIILVPRHPERFDEVAQEIKLQGFAFSRYSQTISPSASIILIDAMGVLNRCYQVATLAIVGGSFAPHVGGHNILEPVFLCVPTLFGPHMHGQPELTDIVLEAKAGIQVTLEALESTLVDLLQNQPKRDHLKHNCLHLTTQLPGSTERTYEKLSPYFN